MPEFNETNLNNVELPTNNLGDNITQPNINTNPNQKNKTLYIVYTIIILFLISIIGISLFAFNNPEKIKDIFFKKEISIPINNNPGNQNNTDQEEIVNEIMSGNLQNISKLEYLTLDIAKKLAQHSGVLELNALTSITPEIADLISSEPASSNQQQEYNDVSKEDQITGIGVIFNQDEPQKIMSVIPEGPAYIAGIKEGDIIIKITDKNKNIFNVNVSNYTSNQISSLIRGSVGSELIINIYREKDKKNFDIKVIRNTVRIPSASKLADTIKITRKRLYLDGIKTIDSETIDKLTNKNGKYDNLSLEGITSINKGDAEKLATHAVVLRLGLTSISPEVARELTKCSYLFLNHLKSISPASAKELLPMYFNGVKMLTVMNDIENSIQKEIEKIYLEETNRK